MYLQNSLGKTYEQIFLLNLAKVLQNLTWLWEDGDVKYTWGYSSDIITPNTSKVPPKKLAPNPIPTPWSSDFVEGSFRAKNWLLEQKGDAKKSPPILEPLVMAAVAGQGIVYEVTQMAGFGKGIKYWRKTIHFVDQYFQVGFLPTDFGDCAYAIYCYWRC